MAKKKSVKKPVNSGDDAGIDRSASGSPPFEQDTASERGQDTPEPAATAEVAPSSGNSAAETELSSLKVC
jgi:hypothetical protein